MAMCVCCVWVKVWRRFFGLHLFLIKRRDDTTGTTPKRRPPTSISFEGCGAAISYHLGVYKALARTYGSAHLTSGALRVMGTSSGCLVALCCALGHSPDEFGEL